MNNNTTVEKSKIQLLIEENEPAANKVIARVLLIMAGMYLLVGFMTAFGFYKADNRVTLGLIFFAFIFISVALYCLKRDSKAVWIKYVQVMLLLISMFMINAVIGYKIWMIFVVPVFLTVRFYNKRFTIIVGLISMILIIASAYVNSYLGPYLGILDLNVVSFKEPGTLEYYSWIHNAVIKHGYDKTQVAVNGLRLSAFPNCLAISISIFICNRIISNAEKMLVNISDSFEKEIRLLREARTDELTGLYNRREYEENLTELSKTTLPNDFVYLSLDLNGLKEANDSFGHAAGDEIIVAAAKCIDSIFGEYGKTYRVGGDEFAVIVTVDENTLENLKQEFIKSVNNWKGILVDKLSISMGCVTMREVDSAMSVNEIAIMADGRMYENKSQYYISNGIDRRKSGRQQYRITDNKGAI